MFEAGVKMSLEKAVRIAELTDIESCDGETASTNFGQWLRIFHRALAGSSLEDKALMRMIRLAKRDKTDKDRDRRIVKLQEIFAIIPSESEIEEKVGLLILMELKRLKKEMKREKAY